MCDKALRECGGLLVEGRVAGLRWVGGGGIKRFNPPLLPKLMLEKRVC